MPTPYPVKFKLPLEFLTLQDWNNFVQNLLFINQYGSAQLLKYYQNGNFKNINDVIAEYLYVSTLKVKGYNVLHNLSEPLAYTFGEGRQQSFQSMSQRPTVSFPYSIPFEFIQFYPLSELPNYKLPIFPIEKLQVQLSAVGKQLQLLIPKIVSKIVTPTSIAGTQFQFSGTANVQTLIEDYLNPTYLQTWREIIIQNLGTSAVQINNSIYLMPKNCLKITANSPSEVQLTAQTPTLLSEEIEFITTQTQQYITVYTITITNNQANPTPSPFQQLLNLNLSSILSSSSQLLNLEFCLDVNCNTPLYAWIESYNTNLSTVYIWLNLPTSIPANSSITIYMFVRNSIQYPYTGMSPTLTSTYGQYDNGGNVFTFYDNFAGTTLNINKWITNGASYTVNNGLTYTTSNNYNVLTSVASFTAPYIIEYFGKGITSGGVFDGGIYFNIQGTGANANAYLWAQRNGASDQFYTYISGSYTGYVTWPSSIDGNMHIYTLIVGPNDNPLITETDYTIEENFTGMPTTYTSGYFGPRALGGTTFWQWVRVRAYPPNGVMPSNSQPQKTIILLS